MPAIIHKLLCTQVPDITIISIGSDPPVYAIHMPQLIGRLTGKTTKYAAKYATQNYLRTEAGKLMEHGGDIGTAYINGSLSNKIYTHSVGCNTSKPSCFLTADGVRYVLETLQYQDETQAKQMTTLIDQYMTDVEQATSCFKPAPEQYSTNSDDEATDIPPTDPEHGQVTPYMWYNCNAQNRVLIAQIEAKDDLIKANKAVASAEQQAAVLKKELELRDAMHQKGKEDAAALSKANSEKEAALAKATKEAADAEIKAARADAAKAAALANAEKEIALAKANAEKEIALAKVNAEKEIALAKATVYETMMKNMKEARSPRAEPAGQPKHARTDPPQNPYYPTNPYFAANPYAAFNPYTNFLLSPPVTLSDIPDNVFITLESTVWPNERQGVNKFIELNCNYPSLERAQAYPSINARALGPDVSRRAFYCTQRPLTWRLADRRPVLLPGLLLRGPIPLAAHARAHEGHQGGVRHHVRGSAVCVCGA